MTGAMTGFSLLTDDDLHLFNEGTHHALGEKMGAHPATAPDGTTGTCFAVWAPNAAGVGVAGDWNDWSPEPLAAVGRSGVWSGHSAKATAAPILSTRCGETSLPTAAQGWAGRA